MTNWWREARDFVLLLVRIVWRLGVSLLVLVLVLVVCRLLYLTYAYHFGFDRVQWTASAAALHTDPEDSFDNPRQHMVEDVIAHELLHPGMSQAAVLALLGPDDANRATDAFVWRYEAGWRGIDPTALVIEFSAQGTVVRSYTRE